MRSVERTWRIFKKELADRDTSQYIGVVLPSGFHELIGPPIELLGKQRIVK